MATGCAATTPSDRAGVGTTGSIGEWGLDPDAVVAPEGAPAAGAGSKPGAAVHHGQRWTAGYPRIHRVRGYGARATPIWSIVNAYISASSR